METNRHKIVIHGLISHHGTLRARYCVKYLRKYLQHLYEKPEIHVYYDVEWIEFVTKIRKERGKEFRRLYYLKNPVIVFLDDKYIGDHRALIQHVTYEHRIIPDLPYPNLFPDFTQFLPRNNRKGYVYLDFRVGDLGDYLVGKMVFELHADLLPETCRFFSELCEPYKPYAFSEAKRATKPSYVGSTIRRICKGSFVQGGAIPETSMLRLADETFEVRHDRRGVLSIANQGSNRSTTEFVISLAANSWMDGNNVAFGQLIFGESLLEAIEEVPTYYQSPLQDVVIVDCGVIPDIHLRNYSDFETRIMKMKAKTVEKVMKSNREMLKQVISNEKKIIELLKRSEEERKYAFTYTEVVTSQEDIITDQWSRVEEGEEDYIYREDIMERKLGEEESSEEPDAIMRVEKVEEELPEDETYYERIREIDEKLEVTESTDEPTLAEIILKAEKKFMRAKTNMMSEFVYSILRKVFILEDGQTQLDDFIIPEIIDSVDVRDVPSYTFFDEIFYKRGLYSLPRCLRDALLEKYNNLSSRKLKELEFEAREILKEGGMAEDSLHMKASEDVISGVLMAVVRVSSSQGGIFSLLTGHSEPTLSSVSDLVADIREDVVGALKAKGPDFLRNWLSSEHLSATAFISIGTGDKSDMEDEERFDVPEEEAQITEETKITDFEKEGEIHLVEPTTSPEEEIVIDIGEEALYEDITEDENLEEYTERGDTVE